MVANAMPQAPYVRPPRRVVRLSRCAVMAHSMLMGDFRWCYDEAADKNRRLNNSVLGFVAMEMKAGGYLYRRYRT